MEVEKPDMEALAKDGELKADATWFHVFRSMYESGQVKEMGPSAFTLYGAIKSHIHFSKGNAFPSFTRLQELTGMSTATISKNLKILERQELLTAQRKKGSSTIYRLRESIPISTEDGQVANASWDYAPAAISKATHELKNFLTTGINDGQTIHINVLNIQINLAENNRINNMGLEEKPINEIIPEGKDSKLRDIARRAVEKNRADRNDGSK